MSKESLKVFSELMSDIEKEDKYSDDESYQLACDIATERYIDGEEYMISTGICGMTTAGYGELDQWGYFQFPLVIDQETYKIII